MNLWKLSWAYVRFNPLTTFLNVLLFASGIATIVVLLLFAQQLEQTLSRNAQGIDLVVGAKGSPLQLILSSVYHADVPTGNIPFSELEKWQQHKLVKQAIPVALGDNFQGFRIVGTTRAYPEHYGATLATGHYWQQSLEAVLGAEVAAKSGLKVGDKFVGTHGITEAGGEVHDEHDYTVTGILHPTYTVLDRLVLTDVASVWEVHSHEGHEHGKTTEAEHHDDDHEHDAEHDHHEEKHEHEGEHDHHEEEHGHHGEGHEHEGEHDHHEEGHEHEGEHDHHEEGHEHEGEHDHHDEKHEHEHETEHGHGEEGHAHKGEHDHHADKDDLELTALLLQYQSPLAAVSLPRMINSESALQAASPAFETARLLQLVGVGIDTLRVFGGILIIAAAFGVFIALYNALRDRRYDLAIMRSLGASKWQLFWLLLLEGLLISLIGTILGLVLGHGLTELIGLYAFTDHPLPLTGWTMVWEEFALVGFAVLIGIGAALLPAIQASQTEIAAVLAEGG